MKREPDPHADGRRARALLAPVFARLGIDAPMEPMIERLYVPLARWAATLHASLGRTVILGVQGAQGAGKSTLAEALGVLLEDLHGLRAVTLSLDDLYLTRAEREALARAVHPLLRTRGVPGTHDVSLGLHTLDSLTSAADAVPLPRFDKGVDDRAPAERSPVWRGPRDVVVFEGWCVGVPPQEPSELAIPVNALEAEEDPDGSWRRYVDAQLRGPYQALWSRLDGLVALGVPSMASVRAFRGRQEEKLAAARGASAPAAMDEAAIARFVMHFERLTLHALRVMPERAEVWVALDPAQQPSEVRWRGAGSGPASPG